VRKVGIVTQVDQQAEIFSIRTPKGRAFTFSLDENIRFCGQLPDLGDLQIGMSTLVAGRRLKGGTLLAVVVAAREAPAFSRHMGIVTSIDAATNTFGLHARNGEQLIFKVDEETRFQGFDVDVQSLDDLQVDMVVKVLAKKQEDGSFLAINVSATTKESLEQYDLRTVGQIIAVDAQGFSVQARNGEQYDFQVTAETRFRSLQNRVAALEDLQVGMKVLVGAEQVGDGNYQAQVVIIGALRNW